MHIEHMNTGTSKASLPAVEELPLAAVFFLLANASLKSVYDSIEQESVSPTATRFPSVFSFLLPWKSTKWKECLSSLAFDCSDKALWAKATWGKDGLYGASMS